MPTPVHKGRPLAPFQFEALRPYVSVTLHRIFLNEPEEPADGLNLRIAEELADGLASLFQSFDIADKNPLKISTDERDRALIATHDDASGLSLAGAWFKRTTAPPWLDAEVGPPEVRDTLNHILIVAVRYPYLAVLGTFDRSRDLLADGLKQGYCGSMPLSFLAPTLDEETLERSFIRGRARVCWLTGLHAPTLTKPDSKTLLGKDLRSVLEPFSDQTYTFSSVVSILPILDEKKVRPRRNRYDFQDRKTARDRELYAYRVGVAPEQHRVWTLQAKEFNHLLEELHVLFDTLELPPNRGVIGDWCHYQEGFKFLGKPVSGSELSNVAHAFDVGFDLPPPVDPGSSIFVHSEREMRREQWRAHGQLEVLEAGPSAAFKGGARYDGKLVLEFEIVPREVAGGLMEPFLRSYRALEPHHDGITCFDTLFDLDRETKVTVRYDSGHVLRGSHLFHLGWQDVLFESWKWLFVPERDERRFSAAMEKPPTRKKDGEASGGVRKRGTRAKADIPDRRTGLGWETTLGTDLSRPALSLFEYVVLYAEELFQPAPGQEWFLCCDDGPGEIADFIYFEPGAGRLHLVHVKGAAGDGAGRDLSVKVYEEVVSQATKNLRYLDLGNLRALLEKGKDLPVAAACFRNGTTPLGNRDALLESLGRQARQAMRLRDRRVIVFQPHVRESIWDSASQDWMEKVEATPQNQINRFLQLRTLLADAELTCRKVGARFEAWGAKG